VRVLIVDDEPDVLLLLQVQMAGRPEIELVGTAVDGEDGVDACRRLRPDAVVMDLLMPKLSGFEAIAVIRGEMPEVAIVAHSAVAGEHVRAQMEALDVPLVLKSGDAGALVAALLEATGRS
jgi:DNA-binding NarL/FixJ family response regulator